MARPALLEALHAIVDPVVQSLGLVVWGIDIIQAGKPVVRIYVDVPHAATVVSDALSEGVSPSAEDGQLMAGEEVLSAVSEGSSLMVVEGALAARSLAASSATIDQCAHISRMVGLAMEVEEIFASAYVLEVSTPGFSRTFFHLAQLSPYVGDALSILLVTPMPCAPRRKRFVGELVSVHAHSFTLRLDDADTHEEVDIAWDSVRKVSRVHIFVVPEKPGKKRKDTAS